MSADTGPPPPEAMGAVTVFELSLTSCAQCQITHVHNVFVMLIVRKPHKNIACAPYTCLNRKAKSDKFSTHTKTCLHALLSSFSLLSQLGYIL